MSDICIDIGSLCTHCGRDTSYGSGLFVNRIASDAEWQTQYDFTIWVDGYMCSECQVDLDLLEEE